MEKFRKKRRKKLRKSGMRRQVGFSLMSMKCQRECADILASQFLMMR
jgi:hypothetical protein